MTATTKGDQAAQDQGTTTNPGGRIVLRVCGATDVGLQREQNQDTFVIADLNSGEVSCPCVEVGLSVLDGGYLLLVCDGMGGAAAGEVAARIAASAIKERLVQAGSAAVSEHPAETLGDAVVTANRAILDEARGHPSTRGMGTTCTAAIVLPGSLTVAQVGDSRAYLLRQGELWALTRDQSLAMQLLDGGVLAPDQIDSFPYRHVLSQALGTGRVKPVLTQYQLAGGDRILLCSDGLHGTISEADIRTTLAAGDLADVTKGLVDRALAAGGGDNVTVVVAEYRSN